MTITMAASFIHGPPLAHRGLHGPLPAQQASASTAPPVPENSLAAVAQAFAHGYGVELDLRLSGDGQVVVFHDPDLERMTGRPDRVDSLWAADLGRLRLLGTGETVPTLAAVLDLWAGTGLPLYLEVKNEGLPGPLERGVARLVAPLAARGLPVAVGSFNPLSLAWLRRQAPALPRIQIASRFDERPGLFAHRRFLHARLAFNSLVRPHLVSYDLAGLPNPWAEASRRRGAGLLAWTARTPEQFARARSLADNVVFEGFLPEPGSGLKRAAPGR